MTRGFGSLLAFEVVGGAPMALSVARHCEVITRATSLGGVESLIEHRAASRPSAFQWVDRWHLSFNAQLQNGSLILLYLIRLQEPMPPATRAKVS